MGSLDALKATPDFAAGPQIGASGQVDLARIGLRGGSRSI